MVAEEKWAYVYGILEQGERGRYSTTLVDVKLFTCGHPPSLGPFNNMP